MPVPYWAWIDAVPHVAKILAASRETKPLTFTWDLLKEDLAACHCFISGSKLQITPHLVPIDLIPSFAKAKRRFFLSATLIDDSILMKEFGVSRGAAMKTIRPPIVGDIGKQHDPRPPSLIDKSLEPEIPALCKKVAEAGFNVVVLVPSFKAGDRWTKAGATLLQNDDARRGHRKAPQLEGELLRTRRTATMESTYPTTPVGCLFSMGFRPANRTTSST